MEQLTQEQFLKYINPEKVNLFKYTLHLNQLKKCPFCKKKYPNGIMRDDNAGKIRELAWMIKPDVLAHIQQTHGLNPQDLTTIFNKI